MILLDIDNTIADDAWRIPRIHWDFKDHMLRYHEYHMLAPFDRAGNVHLFQCKEATRCLVLTSRPVVYRAMTVEWLQRQGVDFAHLLMRNSADHRSSLAVKREQLGWLPLHYDIPLTAIERAYDDRPEIVAMYLEHGIFAKQISIHNVSAYRGGES